MQVKIDFPCQNDNCHAPVAFQLGQVKDPAFKLVCPKCGRAYEMDAKLADKLKRMLNMIIAIRSAEDLIGDTNISVNVAGGEVKVPYAMLLTRLNTLISLELEGKKVDFHLWIQPASPETFR